MIWGRDLGSAGVRYLWSSWQCLVSVSRAVLSWSTAWVDWWSARLSWSFNVVVVWRSDSSDSSNLRARCISAFSCASVSWNSFTVSTQCNCCCNFLWQRFQPGCNFEPQMASVIIYNFSHHHMVVKKRKENKTAKIDTKQANNNKKK